MKINVIGGAMEESERKFYADCIREKYPNLNITSMTIHIKGDYVEIYYSYDTAPFERIRRITGYLTGTVNRWNDAKQDELHDRVKHGGETHVHNY